MPTYWAAVYKQGPITWLKISRKTERSCFDRTRKKKRVFGVLLLMSLKAPFDCKWPLSESCLRLIDKPSPHTDINASRNCDESVWAAKEWSITKRSKKPSFYLCQGLIWSSCCLTWCLVHLQTPGQICLNAPSEVLILWYSMFAVTVDLTACVCVYSWFLFSLLRASPTAAVTDSDSSLPW